MRCSVSRGCVQSRRLPAHRRCAVTPRLAAGFNQRHTGRNQGISESQLVDQVILTDTSINRDQMVELILLCEQNLVVFNIVPDLFRIMTNNVDLRIIDDIPFWESAAGRLIVFGIAF